MSSHMLTFERQHLCERKGWGVTKSVKSQDVFHRDGLVSGYKHQVGKATRCFPSLTKAALETGFILLKSWT